MTRGQALTHNQQLTAITTQRLVRSLESVGLAFQAATIMLSTRFDNFPPPGRTFLYTAAAIHLIAALVSLRAPGPLTRGAAWPMVWTALAFAIPVLTARLIAPGDYASNAIGLSMGGYGMAPAAALAFNKWPGPQRPVAQRLIQVAILAGLIVEPLLLLGMVSSWQFTSTNYSSISVSGGWLALSYLAGIGIGSLCHTAAEDQINAQQRSYQALFNLLHSHISAAMMAIQRSAGDEDAVSRALSSLRQRIAEQSAELLLVRDRVPLSALSKETLRALEGVITFVGDPPRFGPLTVRQEVGVLLHRGLGDFLKNVLEHGGGRANVSFTLEGRVAILSVRDYGPGIAASALEDPANSLNRLRLDARILGGDVIVGPSKEEASGTLAILMAPLDPNEQPRRN